MHAELLNHSIHFPISISFFRCSSSLSRTEKESILNCMYNKLKNRNKMGDYLYEGIIIDILHRLPVKTLLRCTAVCKSWYALINTPQFISSHLKFSDSPKNRAQSLLIRRCIKNCERYELYSDNDSFNPRSNLKFPFRSMNSFFTIVGSCNGLLCISDDRVYYMNTIILWNPSIRKSVLLPKPNLIYNSYGTFTQCLGFGFDSVANDYKVIRITYLDFVKMPQIEVYKLSTGVWQDMSYLGLDYVIYNRSCQVFVNGAVHWIARYMDSYNLIVFFDMCNEVFRTMMLPVSLVNNDATGSADLVVFGEALGVISWDSEANFSVWVMQEYGVEESWSRVSSFDLRDLESGFMRPLWVRRNGEVITIRDDGHLICFDGDEGEVKDLGIGGSRSEEYRRSVHVYSYVSSLVVLKKGVCDAFTCNKLPTMGTNTGYGYGNGNDNGNGNGNGNGGSDYEYESESDCKNI